METAMTPGQLEDWRDWRPKGMPDAEWLKLAQLMLNQREYMRAAGPLPGTSMASNMKFVMPVASRAFRALCSSSLFDVQVLGAWDACEAKWQARAYFTTEAVADFRACFGVDIEVELVAMAAQDLALQVDRVTLGEVSQAAREVPGRAGETVLSAIERAKASIRECLPGGSPEPAFWAVASFEIVTVLDARKGPPAHSGVYEVGRVGDLVVWEDPWMRQGDVLVGARLPGVSPARLDVSALVTLSEYADGFHIVPRFEVRVEHPEMAAVVQMPDDT